MKVVIIGGVAGGASAAARIRRLDESAEIVLLERTGYVSYANCGLPYYVGGVIEDRDDLVVQTPESLFKRFRIDVRTGCEAVSIDRTERKVRVRRLEDGSEYDEGYDRLILSPGARPVIPDMPGIDDPRIMTLRTVEDALRMRDVVVSSRPRRVIVAGGGYIGVEAAENLHSAGSHVILVQRPTQVLTQLDPEMAADVQNHMRSKGVELILGDALTGFEAGECLTAVLSDGRRVVADMALLALGVVPDTGLAREAGLELGVKGAIMVDDSMRTSDPFIYAVGDAVETVDIATGIPANIPLAGPANKQGRLAADNICGIRRRYAGSLGTSVVKVFDMTVASTGVSEKRARMLGMSCDKVYTYSASHASYYPGSTGMSMKVLFDPIDLHILGAQIVGGDGVDKRIDVLATAMMSGLTADRLQELDLSYAPPFSSAKDPVNMAGFVIDNVVSGRVRQCFFDDLDRILLDPDISMVDIRTPREYAAGHLDGVPNIPVDEIRERMGEIPRRKVCLICRTGLRSYIAACILQQNGFECLNLSGGYRLYESVEIDRLARSGAPEGRIVRG